MSHLTSDCSAKMISETVLQTRATCQQNRSSLKELHAVLVVSLPKLWHFLFEELSCVADFFRQAPSKRASHLVPPGSKPRLCQNRERRYRDGGLESELAANTKEMVGIVRHQCFPNPVGDSNPCLP